MSEREINYCPLCGGELSGESGPYSTPYECEECGTEMNLEVWGYEPNFWHSE